MKETIENIEFISSLGLDWQERLSLEYSNGLSSYWNVYHSYRRELIFRTIISYVPLIAVTVAARALSELIKEDVGSKRR